MSLLDLMRKQAGAGDLRAAMGMAQDIFWRHEDMRRWEKKEALRYMVDNYEAYIEAVMRESDPGVHLLLLYNDLRDAYRMTIYFYDPPDEEWDLLQYFWIDTVKASAKRYKQSLLLWLEDAALNIAKKDFPAAGELEKFCQWAFVED